jgi:transcription elongation factor GreA-like protein
MTILQFTTERCPTGTQVYHKGHGIGRVLAVDGLRRTIEVERANRDGHLVVVDVEVSVVELEALDPAADWLGIARPVAKVIKLHRA